MPTMRKLGKYPNHADLKDTLVQATVKIDDGCDHTKRIVWSMNQKRSMRNGTVAPKPEAPQVSPVRIEPIKKTRMPSKQRLGTVEEGVK